MYEKIFKRLFDLVGSCAAILLLAPIFIFVPILIFFTMGNPVLFKHRRTGFKMIGFNVYKFRTMIVDAEKLQLELIKSIQAKAKPPVILKKLLYAAKVLCKLDLADHRTYKNLLNFSPSFVT